jgi:hypothetical protein
LSNCGASRVTIWHTSDSHSFHLTHLRLLPITSRFRAAFGARIVSCPCADPERGGRRSAARRHTGLRSRWRGAMPRWQHAAIPLRSGRRPSALHRGDFRPRDQRFNSGSVHRIRVATCPPARSQDLADWVPYLPRRGSHPLATGRHAPAPSGGSSPETPLMSENKSVVAQMRYVVNSVVDM